MLKRSSLNNLLENDMKCAGINMVGDKGYALNTTKVEHIKETYKTTVRFPHKCNQKIKTPQVTKKLLKKRYVVEFVIGKIKKYDRVCTRKDSLECTYIGFAYLASMLVFFHKK